MKNTKNYIIFSITISLLFFFSSFNTTDNDWSKYKEIDGITIYTKTVKCAKEYSTDKNDYIVFKYVNSNDYNIRISWKLDIWHNDICRSCDLESPNEYEISIDIKAKQTLEYMCSDNNKAFKIFKASEKDNMHPKIKYEFNQLKVIKL